MSAMLLTVPSKIAMAQTSPASSAPRYQPPTIELVLPAPQGTVPADRPVIVFHFSPGVAPGQASDPIDLASFRAWVDGIDRSAFFKMDSEDAWGSLAPLASGSSGTAIADSLGSVSSTVIAIGVHLVTARLCSMRGVCGELHALVTALPGADPSHAVSAVSAMSAVQPPDSNLATHRSLGGKLLSAVVSGIRKLFTR